MPTKLLIAALILVLLAVLTLAMPVPTWRTGEAPDSAIAFDLAPGEGVATRDIWIDTDAACGYSDRTDPDDCLAILLLAQRTDMHIVGISTVAGNASVDAVSRITEELVAQVRNAGTPAARRAEVHQLSVFRGAGRQARQGESAATSALQNALEAQPLSILALGPLSNIAQRLRAEPTCARGCCVSWR